MSRRVAQRPYKPKPDGPGQRITWKSSEAERTGTIWSAGPLPKSVWVQPDDTPSGDMAVVMLRSMIEHPAYPPGWQHDTLRRVEHLRQSKGLFAEYRMDERYSYSAGRIEVEHVVAYHCDRDCQAVERDTRERQAYEPTAGDVIRALLSGEGNGRHNLCRSCIYMAGPEDNGTGHTHVTSNYTREESR